MRAETLLGRQAVVRTLADLALGGAEALLYGPVGIGKTAVLEAVAALVRDEGRPCGLARRTGSLGDATRALAEAYPGAQARTQRGLRGFLRRAVEQRPAVLILDHVVKAPAALRGFLRSLRGTGAGVLSSIDVDQPRDHAWARALHLAYREVELPPLGRRHMRRLLEPRLIELKQRLVSEDEELVLDIARGRPGWIDMIVERLAGGHYWRDARVRGELLCLDVSAAVAHGYIRATNERFGQLSG